MAKKSEEEKNAGLEETLARLEHKLQARYSEIGKSLLELAAQEQKEVNRLVDEIIAARKKLAQGKRQVRCGQCLALNQPGSAYCCQCGEKLCALPQEEAQDSED